MTEKQYGETALKNRRYGYFPGSDELNDMYVVHLGKLTVSEERKLELMGRFATLSRVEKHETLATIFEINNIFYGR